MSYLCNLLAPKNLPLHIVFFECCRAVDRHHQASAQVEQIDRAGGEGEMMCCLGKTKRRVLATAAPLRPRNQSYDFIANWHSNRTGWCVANRGQKGDTGVTHCYESSCRIHLGHMLDVIKRWSFLCTCLMPLIDGGACILIINRISPHLASEDDYYLWLN